MAKLIFGVLGLLGIYVIILGISNMMSSSFLSIMEFFFNSAWGIISLISGALSILFLIVTFKMPQRIKESKTRTNAITPILQASTDYSQSANKNSILSTKKNMKNEIQEKVIDMEAMSLEGFLREVAFTMNKPSPVILKGWGNKRLKLDSERVMIIGSYIQNVRSTCDQYLQLRADMFFAKDKFDYFVKANTLNAKNNLDLIKEEYKDKKWNLEHDRRVKEADLKDREIEQEEKQAKIKEQNARNEFFLMAIKEFPEMPAPLKAYMFTQVHGRYPESKRDFDLEEKINEFIMKKYDNDIENMEVETKKKKEEAKTFIEKVRHERKKKYEE
jgi:hypothetical protein